MVGVAVKVTFVLPQIVLPGLAAMLTDGVTACVTVMLMALEVAVAGEAQPKEEVITTVTTSLFAREAF